MWYFMSLISMVLPPLLSCSDLLVISVLNLERKGRNEAVLSLTFTPSFCDGAIRHLTGHRETGRF